MKKTTIIILFIISILFVYGQKEYYYWYKGEKVYLKENKDKRFVLLKNIESEYILSQRVGNTWHVEKLKKENTVITLNAYNKKSTQQSLSWAILKTTNKSDITIMDLDEIIYDAPFFSNSQNQDIGLSHLFYVKLNKKEDLKILDELSLKHNVEIIGSNKFMPLWYTLSCTKRSTGNALATANLFFETGLFSASAPDLMVDDMLHCVNDTYFNNQWNLNNTGQNGGDPGIDIDICDAWEITSGSDNVIVAVLDQGIELNHPDLLNMSPLSFDTESGTSPSVVLGSHGTACAGIIGASANNNLGIAGVAPNCQLMSISNSLAGTPNSRQRRGDGINWAWQNGADVISNSWGSGVQYPIIDDAIDNALTLGRGGLGCVVVFSAGNNNSAVNYPANSNPDIIAIGANDRCGFRSGRIDIIPNSCDPWCPTCQPGSCYGTDLDVVAPGTNIPTTDRQGSNGYDVTDYTQTFGGTSAAAPHIAGIAALMLSVNPSLTQDEIRDIIESTCTKIGNYDYSTVTGRTNGTWDDEMGYGLVNACSAVFEAFSRIMSVTGPSVVCTSNSTFTLHNCPPGTSIGWKESRNLDYVSGGTNNYTVKAYSNDSRTRGWVRVTITSSCGTIALQKNVWVGRPGTPVTTPDGDPPMEVVYGSSFLVNIFNPPGADPTTGEWAAMGSIVPTTGTSGKSWCHFKATSFGYGQWHVYTSNDCGNSDTYIGSVIVPWWKFGMSPNPADDYVEITAEKKEYDTKGVVSDNYEVKIFNNLKSVVYESAKTNQTLLRISTKQFITGTYYIHFTAGEQTEVKQLIIIH